MTILSWVSLFSGLFGILVSITVLATYSSTRRKAAMEMGRKEEQVRQMRTDLDHAFEKIHALEAGTKTSEIALAEIKTILTHVRDSIDKLAAKLDRHCEQDSDGR